MCGGGLLDREKVTPRYPVRLAVPRIGGLRAWGAAEAAFERRLLMQAGASVTDPPITGETRRGRSFLQVRIEMTVAAADVVQALAAAWRVFSRAAGDDRNEGQAARRGPHRGRSPLAPRRLLQPGTDRHPGPRPDDRPLPRRAPDRGALDLKSSDVDAGRGRSGSCTGKAITTAPWPSMTAPWPCCSSG